MPFRSVCTPIQYRESNPGTGSILLGALVQQPFIEALNRLLGLHGDWNRCGPCLAELQSSRGGRQPVRTVTVADARKGRGTRVCDGLPRTDLSEQRHKWDLCETETSEKCTCEREMASHSGRDLHEGPAGEKGRGTSSEKERFRVRLEKAGRNQCVKPGPVITV